MYGNSSCLPTASHVMWRQNAAESEQCCYQPYKGSNTHSCFHLSADKMSAPTTVAVVKKRIHREHR